VVDRGSQRSHRQQVRANLSLSTLLTPLCWHATHASLLAHYSRLSLSMLVTPVSWHTCFYHDAHTRCLTRSFCADSRERTPLAHTQTSTPTCPRTPTRPRSQSQLLCCWVQPRQTDHTDVPSLTHLPSPTRTPTRPHSQSQLLCCWVQPRRNRNVSQRVYKWQQKTSASRFWPLLWLVLHRRTGCVSCRGPVPCAGRCCDCRSRSQFVQAGDGHVGLPHDCSILGLRTQACRVQRLRLHTAGDS
jgi:hypothetical protein